MLEARLTEFIVWPNFIRHRVHTVYSGGVVPGKDNVSNGYATREEEYSQQEKAVEEPSNEDDGYNHPVVPPDVSEEVVEEVNGP